MLRETLHVKEWAGSVSLSRLARDLGRDVRDVAQECGRLGVPIVYMGAPLYWCDDCARWRTKLTPSGFCKVCMWRRQRQVVEGRIADMLPLLPPSEREKYTESEVIRGFKVLDPKPKLNTAGMTESQAHIARTRYLADIDRWEMRREYRLNRATQKRKERIEHKVKLLHGDYVMVKARYSPLDDGP